MAVYRSANDETYSLCFLTYRRGEETEFFAASDYSGTPYRTLSVRKKPLIQLGSDYYAVDLCFIRDAGYPALLYNPLRGEPDYKKTFEDRQKKMSEDAFACSTEPVVCVAPILAIACSSSGTHALYDFCGS